MASFGWFGNHESKKFNYKPLYYDKEKEQRRKMFGTADNSKEEKENYVPGTYLRGAFRDSDSSTPVNPKLNSMMGIVCLVLLVIVIYYIAKIFPYLFQ